MSFISLISILCKLYIEMEVPRVIIITIIRLLFHMRATQVALPLPVSKAVAPIMYFVFVQEVNEDRIIKENKIHRILSSCSSWFGSVNKLVSVQSRFYLKRLSECNKAALITWFPADSLHEMNSKTRPILSQAECRGCIAITRNKNNPLHNNLF